MSHFGPRALGRFQFLPSFLPPFLLPSELLSIIHLPSPFTFHLPSCTLLLPLLSSCSESSQNTNRNQHPDARSLPTTPSSIVLALAASATSHPTHVPSPRSPPQLYLHSGHEDGWKELNGCTGDRVWLVPPLGPIDGAIECRV
jgi:hypothetical protein